MSGDFGDLLDLKCRKCSHSVLIHTWIFQHRLGGGEPRPLVRSDYKPPAPVGCTGLTDGQSCNCDGYEALPKP